MALKLAIADLVGVKVEGTYRNEDGNERTFKFTLVCDRLPQDELKDVIADPAGTAMDFFRKHAKDWKDQRFVLDGDGNPAPFSDMALELLMSISGMAARCWQAYLTQAVVTAKN